ncbi:hypothetical protein BURK1_02569 [Burkholderiales bacterium]|nr:hypothetical protein BURK1_02569 [Burkholderiales bacterium]
MKRCLPLLAATVALGAGHASGCGDALPAPKRTAESPRHVVVWRTTPSPPVVGEHFTVDLAVCAKPGARAASAVRVDAQMPDHRHGMNYRASVTALGGGRFRAEGMMFHMPGRWVFAFDVSDGATTERISAEEMAR